MRVPALPERRAEAADMRASHPQTPGRIPLASHERGFAQATRGDTSIIFGLMALGVFMLVGAAVDLSRWLNARSHTIDAIDAAVLAAGRALQTGATATEAVAVAQTLYVNNTKNRAPLLKDTVNFEVRENNTIVAAVGHAELRTMFMGLARIQSLPLFVASEAPEARTAHDSSANYNREVVLMLDVSGSMCSPCDKRDAMKAAAKDLVEIMMRNNGATPYWAKIGIVPFSSDLRPPAAMIPEITDPAWPDSREFTTTTGGKRPKTTTVVYRRSPCVAERAGDEKYTDAAPGAGNYLMSVYTKPDGECRIPVSATVVPLTLDKADLLARIQGLTTGGGTAGHLGTAWSSYLLSPNWNNVLPAASRVSAYNTSNLKKIAVLMTDGQYNQEYDANGIDTSDSVAGDSVNGATSAQQAIAICTQMKARGIDVYTVGFALPNQTARDTMNACATDASKAYTAETGEQLKAAFRDIAIRTTELHLSR